jgi:predicted hotdog family 3-hydroxylacyl-ACP dehydratase
MLSCWGNGDRGQPIPWPVHMLAPHSGTMLLLDRATQAGETWAEAEVRIAEDSVFYEVGRGVPAWVGIEYMAQTVAVFDGLRRRRQGRSISIGLLIGTRRYTVNTGWFSLGKVLTIRVDQELLDGNADVFQCRVQGRAVVAESRLNVYVPADPNAFFEDQLS